MINYTLITKPTYLCAMIKNHFFRFSFLICLFIIFIQHLYANNVSDNNIKLLEKALVTDDYTTIIQRLKEINSNQETRTFLDILSSDERLSKQARLMARIHLGNTYYKMNKPNDALLIAQDIYNNSEIKTNAIKQRLNLLLSDTYEDLSKYDSSLYYLEQIIEHKPLATLNLTHGDLYNRKANLFNRLNQFNQAISFYQKALTDHLLNKDSVGIANSYHGFAYAYRKKGMVDSSAFYEYRSLKISENAKYEHGIKLAYQSLAILSYYQKNYKKSIEEAKQLCDLLVKPSDKSTLANTQNLIGINYVHYSEGVCYFMGNN